MLDNIERLIMPDNITIVDEAMIDASPEQVFNAVLDEFAGVSHWWLPYFEVKPRAGTPLRRVGMVSDVKIRDIGTPRFTWAVTKIEEGKSIGVDYSGDFIGTGEWIFQPAEGRTKIKYIWTGRPKRLLFIIVFSTFMDIKKKHSTGFQRGFKSLNDYLIKN